MGKEKVEQKILVGTSGWVYKDWAEMFYPEDLKEDKLIFYAREFNTVELNSSFYHLPASETFKNWRKKTPKDFIFTVKVSRFITHQKRLITDDRGKEAIARLVSHASGLEEKLGVFLIQLPPNFKADTERLDKFLGAYNEEVKKNHLKCGLVIEFRNESWFTDEVMKILEKYKTALVISSSSQIPMDIKFTADLAYIRFHGPGQLFSSKYSEEQLETWAEKIKNFPPGIKKVFVYFNNDFKGYAILNARYLKELLGL